MANIDTQEQLFQQCKDIAEQINSGEYETHDSEESCNAFDYLSDALDIEYTVSSQGEYLGARILVGFGGPNIWINTRTQTIEGYWWSDRAEAHYYNDALGLDDTLAELWACK